jgi:hypothetical protein
MKKSLALVLFAVVILEYALILSTAQAQTQAQGPTINNASLMHRPYIHLYDEQGNLRTEFVQGEKIRIVTYFPSPIYIVKVIDPDGQVSFFKIVISHKCKHYGVFDSGLLSGITDKNGEWHVEAGILCWFKVRSFFVVPFGPLGVVGILAACFTGFGLEYVKTRKNKA